MSATTLPQGTVVEYQCGAGERNARDRTWCREGMAIALESGVLVDTYWGSGNDNHVLTEAETATAETLFVMSDYDELDRYSAASPGIWETYAEADRQVITSQHRLQRRYFIRKGATPDLETQIETARQRLRDAHDALASAGRTVEWRARDLAELEARR